MALKMFERRTERTRIPHPPLSLRVHLIVESAIQVAWESMMIRRPLTFDLETADEDTITLELHKRLTNEVFDKGIVDGFDTEIFASIAREPKVQNFDGSHPDKMPDMVIEFINRPPGSLYTQHALFIECKPVDRKHPAGSFYCDRGLLRFVCGDYAWAMQSALMIGYVRRGYPILPQLSKALSTRQRKSYALKRPEHCRLTVATAYAQQVATSAFLRTFSYVETGQPADGIVIRHLWLNRF